MDLSLGEVCVRCFASDFYKKLEKEIDPTEEQKEVIDTGEPSVKTEKTTQMIIDLTRDNPRITYDEIARETGKSRVTVKRYVQRFQNEVTISRDGGKRHGRWIISDKDSQH